MLYPFDDYHRFHRPAALIAAAHPRIEQKQRSIDSSLKWLAPDPITSSFSDADLNTIKALGGVPPRGFRNPGE